MVIFLNQKLYHKFVAFVAIAIVIGKGGLCVRESLDDAVNNYFKLIDGTPNNKDSTLLDGLVSELVTHPVNLNLSELPGELCNRVCISGQLRVCYFEFTLEYYQAMGVACGKCRKGVEEDCNKPQCIVGDGVEKGVMSINRQVPGPAIQVCKDDLIIVDVHNNAHGTAAALHWHGLHMVDTPHMDGVPFVTQCPISYANSFRYQLYATEAGTQFYHSHAGHHKANGQYGALIVRRPEEPSAISYDHDLPEHHILISDWMHAFAEEYFPGLPSSLGIYPDSVLINGRGVYTNPKIKERTKVQPTIYHVNPGRRYRFRLINSISHACPFQLQIERHNLTIISSDSHDVLPQSFDTLVSNGGERYDFILNANHTNGDFWIRVRGLGVCSINPTESYALIKYNSSGSIESEGLSQIPQFPNYEEQYPLGKILNHPNASCWGGKNEHCITELTCTEHDQELRYSKPDHKFYLSFQNHLVPNEEVFETGKYNHFANLNSNLTIIGAIDNLTLVLPDYPPLTQPELIDDSQFCNSSHLPEKCVDRRLCPCTHRLKVKLNSIVELIIVDESKDVGRMHHPFHLHGYKFMVTGLGQHPYGFQMSIALAKQLEKIRISLVDFLNPIPPFKDTVSIPSAGYAVVRFRATNPGFWLMHCHYEWHLAIGMGLILQVGEPSDMVKVANDFPKCGNYLPAIQSRRS